MIQLASTFRGMGGDTLGNPFGGGGAVGGFPAPGVPSTGVASSTSSSTSSDGQQQQHQPPPNPFAAFFPHQQPGTTGAGVGTGGPLFNPALLQQMQTAFGGFGGLGAPAAPADSRPPEERFQTQLQVRVHSFSVYMAS